MRTFASVAELLGDGDNTDANEGTFENVLVQTGPDITECPPGQVVVAVKAACINYPDLLQTVVRAAPRRFLPATPAVLFRRILPWSAAAVQCPARFAFAAVAVALLTAHLRWSACVLPRQGGYQHKPDLPFTPGQEVAGVVTHVGEGVGNVVVGDRVQCGGGMASTIVTSASGCWKIPDHYSFTEGATFSTGYSTAYHCLIERGELQAGETILVHGATGGMGMAAVHIAKAVGATVLATGGSDEKLAIVAAQGADHTICYETTPGFKGLVKELTGGKGCDVVFDPVGGAVFDESMPSCCAYGCRFLLCGFTSGIRPVAKTNHVLIKGISLMGCRAGEAIRQGQADGGARQAVLRQWAAEGRLRPFVSHVVPLGEVKEAFQMLWNREVTGRICVAPDGVEAALSTAGAAPAAKL